MDTMFHYEGFHLIKFICLEIKKVINEYSNYSNAFVETFVFRVALDMSSVLNSTQSLMNDYRYFELVYMAHPTCV